MIKKFFILTLTTLVLLFNIAFININRSQVRAEDTLIAQNKQDGWVMFNTNSYKFHNPGCKWAKKCTVNCIRINYSEAISRGGIPCKVCGGTPAK